jgi:predicted RNase H-like nuclease
VRVVGIDGCRGGWLAACVDGDQVQWRWTRDAAELLALPAEAVAIDIPIGLPERGRRTCDVQAREVLRHRRSTVFLAPPRAVLATATYAEARELLARLGEPSMSAQAYGIVAAIRSIDDVVSPADEDRVFEAHPELAFLRMTGELLPPKKSADGQLLRIAAVKAWLPDLDSVLAGAPRPSAVDDALDALACAWVGRRWVSGEAVVVGDGGRDARGLPMRIVS